MTEQKEKTSRELFAGIEEGKKKIRRLENMESLKKIACHVRKDDMAVMEYEPLLLLKYNPERILAEKG